jgi:hypothetical protein
MKKHFHTFLVLAASGVLCVTACKKDEQKVIYDGGTAPVLSASGSGPFILLPKDTANTAVTFSWTNPNYQFSDGISSQNVTYNLQFDTTTNFDGPNLQTVSISSSLGTSFTVNQLNSLVANGLVLATGVSHTVQVRVQSSLTPYTSGSALPALLTSNTTSFTVTPFAPPPAVTPPAEGTLFIVGSAVAGGWNNPITYTPITAQQFTQVAGSNGLEYTIKIALIGGGEYKWIAVNGSWGEQWSVATADTYPNGGPFVSNGNNSIAPASSGTYLIDVNFQTGKFTVTPD